MDIMKGMKGIIPLRLTEGGTAKGVSVFQRLSHVLFGSPNWRRANGIIGTRFEARLIASRITKALRSLSGRSERKDEHESAPVFSLDRRGTVFNEGLPRIWLSERVSNTKADSGRRVFVECYPCGEDVGGRFAFELARRYLGEGMRSSDTGGKAERLECLKAAEILLMHAVRKGNREAARELRRLYDDALLVEHRWSTYLERKAKHSHPMSGWECKRNSL